ncbi:MAG: hypothetical protein AAGA88_08860, partial [Pseudomonadota bacterium]
QSQNNRILDISDALQASETATPELLSGLDAPLNWATATSTCRSDRHRLIVQVKLAALDVYYENLAFDGNDDLEPVDAQFEKTLASLDNALACLPTDGEFWMQRAMVSIEALGPTETTLNSFEKSFWFSPYEAWTTVLRAEFAAQFLEIGEESEMAESILQRDVQTLARYQQMEDLQNILDVGGRRTFPAYAEAFEMLEPENASALKRMIGLTQLKYGFEVLSDAFEIQRQ